MYCKDYQEWLKCDESMEDYGNTIVSDVASLESYNDATNIRLGHLSECRMMEHHKRNLLNGVSSCKIDLCKYCVLGK